MRWAIALLVCAGPSFASGQLRPRDHATEPEAGASRACVEQRVDGLDVAARQEVLVRPEEPTLGGFDEAGCVGLVVVPRTATPVEVRLFGRDGATWQRAITRPLAFVRGCGEPRWLLRAAQSVVVTVVIVRRPPAALRTSSCGFEEPGLAAQATPVGPEPPRESAPLPELEAPWELDTALALDVHGEHRVDLAARDGCVRVDIGGPVTGGRLIVGSFAAELWAMPYGGRAWACGVTGATALFVEGRGALAVRVSRTSSVDLGLAAGPEADATWVDSLGAARARRSVVQAYLRAGERLGGALDEDSGDQAPSECRRWIAVAGDESIEARFELRLVAGDGRLVGRARGGPGRAARVDTCEAVAQWELVQLGPAGRVVLAEATW